MRILELLEDRRDFLRTRYLPLIADKWQSFRIPPNIREEIQHSDGTNPPEQIFSWLESRDPTKKKIYLQWILSCAVDRNVPFEDLEYLPDTLAVYEEKKRTNQLPLEARDINRVKTPSELDILLRGEETKQAAASDAETQAAMRDSKLIYQDANWLIVIPRTEKAAQFWGRGTEWCTAWGDPRGLHPKRSCRFDAYNKDGPLVVIINKQDPQERYQWHSASHQYMDRNDHKDTKMIEQLPQQAWASVGLFVPLLAVRHMKNPTPEIELAAVKQNGNVIKYIPNPTPETQLAAVKQDIQSIRYINNPTPEVQLAAVKSFGPAIEYIKRPSPEVQLAAVKSFGTAIEYIKRPSPEVQLAAVKDHGRAIRFIKRPSPEVQLAAVTQDGQAIYYINNPSPEVQLAAVKSFGPAIEYIKNPSPETQLAAVKQDGRAIRYIKNPSPEVLAYVRQQRQNR